MAPIERPASPRPRVVALALATALLACAEPPPPEFRIGVLTIAEGPAAPVSGVPTSQGALLAADSLNASGGVRIGNVWHRVVLVERAMELRPDAAAAVARAMINLDSVDVIVGPQTSVYAAAAGSVAEASRVPLVAPMASNPLVTDGRAMVFRLAFDDAFQGTLLARYAYDSLRVRRVAALYDAASTYGRGIVQLFSERFGAHGGSVVGVETFDTDAPADYRPQLRRLLARAPDAILLPNYALHDSVQVRQARALGFRGRFLGSDSWDPVAMTAIPEASGTVVSANWDRRLDRDATRRFVARYEARFGEQPRTTAAATFDAVLLVAEAARRAGSTDGPAIADALRTLGPWDGAGGAYEFVGRQSPRRGGVVVEMLLHRDSLRAVAAPEH